MSFSVNHCRVNAFSAFSEECDGSSFGADRRSDLGGLSVDKEFEPALRIAKDHCNFDVKRKIDNGPNKITLHYSQLEKKIKHMDAFYCDDGWTSVKKNGYKYNVYEKFALAIHAFVHDRGVEHRKITFMGEKDVSIFYQETSKRFVSITKDNALWSGWELSTYQVEHLKSRNTIGAHDSRMPQRGRPAN